jgi:hypothetical protein
MYFRKDEMKSIGDEEDAGRAEEITKRRREGRQHSFSLSFFYFFFAWRKCFFLLTGCIGYQVKCFKKVVMWPNR